MKVIIAGSRIICDLTMVEQAVRESGFVITEVVSGAADGVDTLGEQWAKQNHIPVKQFPVSKDDWKRYGKAAGHRRNGLMAEYGEALIVVWTGQRKTSPGSYNMLKQARERGLKIHEKVCEL